MPLLQSEEGTLLPRCGNLEKICFPPRQDPSSDPDWGMC